MTLAEAFDAERRKKQAIMMDISKATGIGLADLSSMRHGRFIPDDIYLIRLEKFFSTEQGYFRALAEKERPQVIEVEESVIMGLQQEVKSLHIDTGKILEHIAKMNREIADLQAWKDEHLKPVSPSKITNSSYKGIEGFCPHLGATIRECIDCGCLVPGGPTRCNRCANMAGVNAMAIPRE
ncbi:MAG: hypothetical protein AB2L14_25385 [Candidatus Xenobiia bacterium LiM19]